MLREKNLQKLRGQEVIDIPTEEEEKSLGEKSIENQHLKYEIAKAQLTGSRLNVILAVAEHFMPGSIEQKCKRFTEYLLNFFASKANINL